MSYVGELFENLQNGMPVENKMCPRCGKSLSVILYGLRDEEFDRVLKKNHIDYCIGGCLCFGDDRDPVFHCSHCNKNFNRDLKPIRLISCPLEASNCIIQGECRKYSLLEQKNGYELLTEREIICNKICPAYGQLVTVRTKDGEKYRGILQRTWQGNNDDNPRGKVQLLQMRQASYDSKEIYIDEITSIRYSRIRKVLHLGGMLENFIMNIMAFNFVQEDN